MLLRHHRKKNKRALRRKEAFPITLSYLVPMMKKAEADDRPIGWRDSAAVSKTSTWTLRT
ncbi:hypothetical protein ACIQ7D_10560 [Streptomyces sp. NPDC096310]|uniref:hypothetical protein n=1 Tax=Streptomyces sp. NPDC096310 TaxID=3366082 RepID=UPI00382C6AE3